MPAIRDRLGERVPLSGHDGASGARLERARLDDGSPVVVKTFDPQHDLTMVAARRTVPLDVELWAAGVLDRLPRPLAHPILDCWQEDGAWVIAMRDLGDTLYTYRSRIGRDTCRHVLAAAAGMHREFAGQAVAGLWPLEDRIGLFSPAVMSGLTNRGNDLPTWCLAGWDRFTELAPRDVVELVATVHDRPEVLAGPLRRRGGVTLLHGDFWLPNLAVAQAGPAEADYGTAARVTVIDWALATAGPGVVEFTSFLVGCAGQVAASREQILDDLRRIGGVDHDEELLRIGLLGGVVEMGWNLAWYAAEGTPESKEPLDWWVAAARRGAELL